VLAAAVLASCGGGGGGGGGSASIQVSVSISPLSGSVPVGTTQQFTAKVVGSSNTAVKWEVNSVEGGNSTLGTISGSGLYTAPAAIPSAANVTITAVSQADSTKAASATVTVTIVVVSVSPSAVTVAAGQTQAFTPTVTGVSNEAVTWQVNGVDGGNSTVGTITSEGVYTAPLSPPLTGAVTVSALSKFDPTKSGTSTVTVVFSDATLNGQYSFLLTGDDSISTFLGVGSFTADGQGGVSNGIEDLNSSTGYLPKLALSGSYTVDADGRGTLELKTTRGTVDFSLIVISSSRARFVEFNTSSNGEGLLLQRDPTAFSAAALSGDYAFGFGGSDANGFPAAIAGRFTANSDGTVTSGVKDSNKDGVISSNVAFTGTYTVDSSNGRGTAKFVDASGTTNFVFHVVSKHTLFFVETDYPYPVVDGTASRQQQATFSASSFKGNYAFLYSGITPAAYIATAGRMSADGAGHLTGGVFDQNDNVTVSSNTAFTGTNSVSSVGRGTFTLSTGTSPLAFYMVSPSEAFVISEDPNAIASGTMLAQTGGAFDTNPPSGSFAFLLYTSTSDTDQAGQVTLVPGRAGSGSITGIEDINDDRLLTAGAGVTGTYAVSSNGRGTAAVISPLGTPSFAFYMVSSSRLFVVEDDATSVTSGNIEKQY
jgi:hypothetical protein